MLRAIEMCCDRHNDDSAMMRRIRGETHVFCPSDRPTIIHANNQKLSYSNLNENEVRGWPQMKGGDICIVGLGGADVPDVFARGTHVAHQSSCCSDTLYMFVYYM